LAIAGAVQWGRFTGRFPQSSGNDARYDLTVQRRNAPWTGLVAQQAVHAFLHEPLLPTPHAGLRHTGLAHDFVRADAVCRKKHDTRPPNVLLRTIPVYRNRLKTRAIRGAQFNEYPCAHSPDSHEDRRPGIQKGILSSDFIH
jgi:hypothetical protein